jgi:hypothetical protein
MLASMFPRIPTGAPVFAAVGLCGAPGCLLDTAKGEAATGSVIWRDGDPNCGSEQPNREAELAAAAAAAAAIASGGSCTLNAPVPAAGGVVAGKPVPSVDCCNKGRDALVASAAAP